MSHYFPPLGGVNCLTFVNGQCISDMASGQPWSKWLDKSCACPTEFPFGTKFIINGKEYICMDRGGKIIIENGYAWLDILTENASIPFGTIVKANYILP